MSGRGQLKIRARRRIRLRSALLLALGVCLCMGLLRMLMSGVFSGLPRQITWLTEMLATIACFGGGSYLGLLVLDGDHRKAVPLRLLTREQLRLCMLLGVLAAAPATLAADVLSALSGMGAAPAQAAALPPAWFVQTVIKSALLVPVCEELFFRGYLLGALRRFGDGRAVIVSAVCFALAHGFGSTVPHALLGALLGFAVVRTGSLAASAAIHACYNLFIIVVSYAGLDGLFSGGSLAGCALRILMCAGFVYVLGRLQRARGTAGEMAFADYPPLRKHEKALLIALAAVLLVLIVTGG